MIFIDTSAWVALYVRNDRFHEPAAEFAATLERKSITLVSTFDIFGETLTVIRSRSSFSDAISFGDAFLSSRVLIREEVDAGLRQEAWSLFKQYRDKPLSFTDCISFALMRKRGLRRVFSYDEDFRRLGFLVNAAP